MLANINNLCGELGAPSTFGPDKSESSEAMKTPFMTGNSERNIVSIDLIIKFI